MPTTRKPAQRSAKKKSPSLKSPFKVGKKRFSVTLFMFVMLGVLIGGAMLIRSRAADDCSAPLGASYSRACWLQSTASGRPGDLLTCDKATGGAKGCDPRYTKVFVCADSKGRAHDVVVPFAFPSFSTMNGVMSDAMVLDYCKADMPDQVKDPQYNKVVLTNNAPYDARFCWPSLTVTRLLAPGSQTITANNFICTHKDFECRTVISEIDRQTKGCALKFGGYAVQYEPGKYFWDTWNGESTNHDVVNLGDPRCPVSFDNENNTNCGDALWPNVYAHPPSSISYWKVPSKAMLYDASKWLAWVNKELRTQAAPLDFHYTPNVTVPYSYFTGNEFMGNSCWVLTKPSGKSFETCKNPTDASLHNDAGFDQLGNYKIVIDIPCAKVKQMVAGFNPATPVACTDGTTVLHQEYNFTVTAFQEDPMRTYVEQNLLGPNGKLKPTSITPFDPAK